MELVDEEIVEGAGSLLEPTPQQKPSRAALPQIQPTPTPRSQLTVLLVSLACLSGVEFEDYGASSASHAVARVLVRDCTFPSAWKTPVVNVDLRKRLFPPSSPLLPSTSSPEEEFEAHTHREGVVYPELEEEDEEVKKSMVESGDEAGWEGHDEETESWTGF
ncbi:hypothetical protein ONZ45_g10286 [Pleurotus djamor]|nr:hypothetical protein ONZ45_g10286 [Pleurotus djamor]